MNEIKEWKNEKEKELEKLHSITLEDIDSKIFKNAQDIKLIERRLKNNNKFLTNRKLILKLLYRATRDGDRAFNFHEKCDDIRGTLTLVKTTKGFRFGGYTNERWNSSSMGYKSDKSAFCFSLDFKKIYNVKTNNAIWTDENSLPCFGNSMFYIKDSCFREDVEINDGLNVNYDNQNSKSEISGGEGKVRIVDLEVFQVLFD